MSDPKQQRDSDRDSLTGWTLVDHEGTPESTTQDDVTSPPDGDEAEGGGGEEEEEEEAEEESECGMEEDVEEDEESLPDDLVTMGQKVQEIKGESFKVSSGSDSSDIETLDCPSSEEYLEEDHTTPYDSLHSSLLSSSSLTGFTFVGGSEEGDVESLASTDISILDEDGKEKLVEEETDLSLASSPLLPDDLPAIRPDTQYKHTPDRDLNGRLNVVVALTLACVLGLGLGHFLGWSSRTMWQENLNSAQVRRLRELQDDLVSCMSAPSFSPSHPVSLESQNQYWPDADYSNSNPESPFIPVLPEGDSVSALHIESFVESIVVPLEDAGVILNPSRRKFDSSLMHSTHNLELESTDPTFATPDILYNKPSMIPLVASDLGINVRERLNVAPEPYTATNSRDTLTEDKIELSSAHLSSTENVPLSSEIYGSASSPASDPFSETDPFFESWPSVELQLPQQASSSLYLPEDTHQAAEEDLVTDSPSPLTVEAVQIIEALTTENRNMESEITRLQHKTIAPIKIGGKDGKMARDIRERINHLILDNEELRMAIGKLQFASVPEGDKEAFNHALKNNYNLRIAVTKLMHLGPNLSDLKVSANDLQAENQELQIQVGKLRYQQQPLPQELNAVAREIENMKKTVNEASKQKKVPPSLENARIYVTYMSQILSGIQTLHEFGESGFFEKINVATDVFEGLVPGSVKLPPATQQKLDVARTKFNDIRVALSKKWEKVKELSQPESIVDVGRDTLTKMNRVIVNVVNKMKEIGQSNIINRGKTSVEMTITTLAERLSALGAQFDKTWNSLEDEINTKEKEENVASVPAVSEEKTLSPELVQISSVTEEVEEEEEEVVAVEETVEEEVDSKGKLDAEEAQPAVAISGRGDKKGEDEGDKRKQPEDKKNKKASKKEEKKKKVKKEDKQERKHQKSRRNRIRSSEEKKEKDEKAAGKQKESKKNNNEKARQEEERKKGRLQDKHDKSREAAGSSQRHDKDKKSQEENKKYYKGQYNKYDKKRHHDDDDDDDDDRDSRHYRKKYQKKNGYDDDDDDDFRKQHQGKHGDDDDDDDDDGSSQLKRHKGRRGDDDEDKKKGLKRHWQQPSRKNHHREFTGPKKAFIRRRGKNQTQPYYHTQQREWASKRAEGRVRGAEEQKSNWMFDRARDRSQRRESERKSDWQFDRAKERSNKRDREQVADWQFDRAKDRSNRREKDLEADWQFDRAQGRKEMRYVDKDHDRYGHDKYEDHEGKQHYVRFDDDDDDDEYDDGDYYRYHQHQNHQGKMKYNQRKKEYMRKKGQREWVIPNLSASGKAFYR